MEAFNGLTCKEGGEKARERGRKIGIGREYHQDSLALCAVDPLEDTDEDVLQWQRRFCSFSFYITAWPCCNSEGCSGRLHGDLTGADCGSKKKDTKDMERQKEQLESKVHFHQKVVKLDDSDELVSGDITSSLKDIQA